MASSYPGAKQTFTDPSGTSLLTGVDHAGLHTDINDTVEAIQDTIGTTAGTNVLKDFSAGNFPVRVNSSNVLQQNIQGTINNSVMGTPAITGGTTTNQNIVTGTISNPVIGTPALNGGTYTGKPRIDTNFGTISVFTDAGTISFDLNTSSKWLGTLGGNRVLEVSNVTVGQPFSIFLRQDATGTRTVTWFSGISWAGSTTPTLTVTAGRGDWFGFIPLASGTYSGFVIGQNV